MNSSQISANRPVYSSTITISKSVKNGFEDDSHLNHVSANPSFGAYNSTPLSVPLTGMQRDSVSPNRFPAQNAYRNTPSDLTDNLSTLESMLQDLDSAHGYSQQNQSSSSSGRVAYSTNTEQLKQINRNVDQSQFVEYQQPPHRELRNLHLDEIDSHATNSRAGSVRVAGQDQVNIPQEKLLSIPDLQQMRLGQSRPVVMTMTELRRETTTLPGGYEEHQHYQYFDQGHSELGNQPRLPGSNVQLQNVGNSAQLQNMGNTGVSRVQGYNEIVQQSRSSGLQSAGPAAGQSTGMIAASPASFEQHQQYQYYSNSSQGQGFNDGPGPMRPLDGVQPVDTSCSIIGQGLNNNDMAIQGNSFEQTTVGGRKAGMSTASRDLEDLMTSISEFDAASSTKNNNLITPSNMAAGSDQYRAAPTHGGDSTDQYSAASGAARMASELMVDSSSSNIRQPVPTPQIISQASKSSIVVMNDGQRQDINGGIVGMSNRREAMLVKLDGDAGELTLPRGNCAACNNPIVGQVLLALGKVFHTEHFACAHCKQQLGTNIFFERDGQPFCERDYLMLFSPKCGGCNGAILEKCITAVNKSWHPEHFLCAACGQQFGDSGFHEKDGKVYCSADYFAMFAPMCGGCNKAILHNYISALHNQWHPECFVCRECGSSFDTGSFYDHDGFPFCEKHFHAKRGSLCASCHNPIIGRCIAAMYKKYHPEHFICTYCLHPLNKGTFKEHSDKPYCHPCFDKLFG